MGEGNGKKIKSDINAWSVACLQTNHSFFFIQFPQRHCSNPQPEFIVLEYSGISRREITRVSRTFAIPFSCTKFRSIATSVRQIVQTCRRYGRYAAGIPPIIGTYNICVMNERMRGEGRVNRVRSCSVNSASALIEKI